MIIVRRRRAKMFAGDVGRFRVAEAEGMVWSIVQPTDAIERAVSLAILARNGARRVYHRDAGGAGRRSNERSSPNSIRKRAHRSEMSSPRPRLLLIFERGCQVLDD
jgi:hypothetical protein